MIKENNHYSSFSSEGNRKLENDENISTAHYSSKENAAIFAMHEIINELDSRSGFDFGEFDDEIRQDIEDAITHHILKNCFGVKVVCDETNNTPETIERNELFVDFTICVPAGFKAKIVIEED